MKSCSSIRLGVVWNDRAKIMVVFYQSYDKFLT